jgi:hypothetical protein
LLKLEGKWQKWFFVDKSTIKNEDGTDAGHGLFAAQNFAKN